MATAQDHGEEDKGSARDEEFNGQQAADRFHQTEYATHRFPSSRFSSVAVVMRRTRTNVGRHPAASDVFSSPKAAGPGPSLAAADLAGSMPAPTGQVVFLFVLVRSVSRRHLEWRALKRRAERGMVARKASMRTGRDARLWRNDAAEDGAPRRLILLLRCLARERIGEGSGTQMAGAFGQSDA